ncbi:MAG TPA: PAS domain-containing protein, partial [Micropepsaceae bacterium]|nr:PAS domain-containing protein [Micropepsaceae bacterium]
MNFKRPMLWADDVQPHPTGPNRLINVSLAEGGRVNFDALKLCEILNGVAFSLATGRAIQMLKPSSRLAADVVADEESSLPAVANAQSQLESAIGAAVLAAIQNSSPDGVLLVNPQGQIVSRNRRFLEIWMVPPELADSKSDEPMLAFVADAVVDRERFLSRVQHLYAHPAESSHDEVALKDGRTLDRYSSPVKLDNGTYLGRVWFFRDITAHINAEAERRAGEERFRHLVEHAPDAILLYDADQKRFVSANRSAEILFGCREDELIYLGPQHFYCPDQPDGR